MRPTPTRRSAVRLALATVLLLPLAAWGAASSKNRGEGNLMGGRDRTTTGLGVPELEKVARTRVFFGHQSVGMSLLAAVPGLYRDEKLAAVPVQQESARPGGAGGFLDHVFLGRNEDPELKIDDFAARLRSGLGHQVDVALMKFCYVDITSRTDVHALFGKYRDTIAALEREFPDVTFVHVTVPLTTEPRLPGRVRALLTRSDRYMPAENVVRERLNNLIRQEYAGHHLFDLAALESTAPDGTRVSGEHEGQPYFALYDGYASDNGHLDGQAASRAAAALLKTIAAASPL